MREKQIFQRTVISKACHCFISSFFPVTLPKLPHIMTSTMVNLSDFKWYRAFHRLTELFRCHGYEVRLVGGAVRDLLLDLAPRDLDVCTTAQPEELVELLSEQNIRYIETG